MQGKSLAFFERALERQQEKGLQIKTKLFAQNDLRLKINDF